MRARKLFVRRPLSVAVSMVIASLMLTSLRLYAQTSSAVIPFQGQLASQSGEPLSPLHPVTMVFRLYENPVGGVALWEEIQPNIVIIAGRFNALLGSHKPFSDLRMFNRPIYLGITLDDGDSSTIDVEMRPRQAIVPVISAISARNSDKLNGHDWSDLLVGGTNDPSSSRIRTDKLDLSSLDAKIETLTKSLEQEQASTAAAIRSMGQQFDSLILQVSQLQGRDYGLVWTDATRKMSIGPGHAPTDKSQVWRLGTHDLCILQETTIQHHLNSTAQCEVSSNDGVWILKFGNTEDGVAGGAITNCAARCADFRVKTNSLNTTNAPNR